MYLLLFIAHCEYTWALLTSPESYTWQDSAHSYLRVCLLRWEFALFALPLVVIVAVWLSRR